MSLTAENICSAQTGSVLCNIKTHLSWIFLHPVTFDDDGVLRLWGCVLINPHGRVQSVPYAEIVRDFEWFNLK